MPTCKDFLREISEFLDGDVDAGLRRELEAHLAECPNCWVVMDTTKRTLRIYKGMEPDPLPEELHARLLNALERASRHEPKV